MGRLLASARNQTEVPANFNTVIVPVKIKIKIIVELYRIRFGFKLNFYLLKEINYRNTVIVPVKIKIKIIVELYQRSR